MIAAIDPGKDGAWAVQLSSGEIYVQRRNNCPAKELVEDLLSSGVKRVLIEEVEVLPGKGNISATVGSCIAWGELRGYLLASGIGVETCRARDWKKFFGITAPKASPKERKQLSVRKAMELFPDIDLIPEGCRVPHDGLAEALLILEYGIRKGVLRGEK